MPPTAEGGEVAGQSMPPMVEGGGGEVAGWRWPEVGLAGGGVESLPTVFFFSFLDIFIF